MKYTAIVHPKTNLSDYQIQEILSEWKKENDTEVVIQRPSEAELSVYRDMIAPWSTDDEFWNPDHAYLVPEKESIKLEFKK
jgi:hypothetical protein